MKQNSWAFLGKMAASLILLITAFATLYWTNSSEFSFANPNKQANLSEFLASFFETVCVKSDYAEVVRKGSSCTYNLTPRSDLLPPINRPASWIQFDFHSYEQGKLNIEFRHHRGDLENTGNLVEYSGIMELSLDKINNATDEYIVRFIPHFAANRNLIKPLNNEPHDHLFQDRYSQWGIVLTRQLLDIKPSNGMIGFDQDYGYFFARSETDGYFRLKTYFEDGQISFFPFSGFVLFSASILTASSFGDIVPNSNAMRLAVAIQSILGIFWITITAGFIAGIFATHPGALIAQDQKARAQPSIRRISHRYKRK